jgi:two-component system, chemotaxis family, CheB/CheR fusion protein
MTTTHASTSFSVPAPASPHAAKVLIVEDDAAVRESLTLLLQAEGHRTIAAADGSEAFALTARGTVRPNVVIADYELPSGQTGLQVAAALRTTLHKEIPVVILGSDVSAETQQDIARQHCIYLRKPPKAADLTRLIRKLLTPDTANATSQPQPEVADTAARTWRSPIVFVVDDDSSLREAMGEMLREHGHTVELCASAEAFLEIDQRDRAGCLVIDGRLPGMDGIALVRQLKREGVQIPAIMMTGYGDVPTAVAAMKAGAIDFLEKPVRAAELLASIDAALAEPPGSGHWASSKAAAARLAVLTVRERQVMDEVIAGHANKEIAARLDISQRTVENHRAAVMQRTNTTSLPELVRLAMRAGVPDSDLRSPGRPTRRGEVRD